MENEKQNESVSLTQAEMDSAFSGPAVLSNRFIITTGLNGVRIAFLEQYGTEKLTSFRSAVVISPTDAIALYKLLKSMLRDVEVAIEKSSTGH